MPSNWLYHWLHVMSGRERSTWWLRRFIRETNDDEERGRYEEELRRVEAYWDSQPAQ